MSKITLNYLVSYLTDKNEKKEPVTNIQQIIKQQIVFPSKPNIIIKSSDFPDKFKLIFENNFYRIGIPQYSDQKNIDNISAYYSILCCINNKFLERIDQINYIKQLKNKIKDDLLVEKLFSLYKLRKFGFTKFLLINEIKKMEMTNIVLHYISCYFDINIFVFNFENNSIYAVYNEDVLNIYKKNIFLANIGNNYEPIINNNNNGLYNYNDEIMINILTSQIIPLNVHIKNKIIKNFEICNNVSELVKIYINITNDDDKSDEEFKDDINEPVKEEVEEKNDEQIKEEVEEQNDEQIDEQIKEEVEEQIDEQNDDINEPVKEEVKEQIGEQIKEQIKEDVEEQIDEQIKEEVKEEIEKSIKEQNDEFVKKIISSAVGHPDPLAEYRLLSRSKLMKYKKDELINIILLDGPISVDELKSRTKEILVNMILETE